MLKCDSKEILNYIVKCRRYLHTIPELGGDLPKTREFVINELNNFKNIKYTKNKKDSGIIAYINNLYKSAYYKKNNKSSLSFLIGDDEDIIDLIAYID